jgi:hypothetical protein
MDAPAVYRWTGPTGVKFVQERSADGTYFHQETPEAVRAALDAAIATNHRLRVFYGDPDSGRCWNDEFHTLGTVGRSTGPICVPILLANSRSVFGGVILDASIIGIQFAPTWWKYRVPNFDVGQWEPGPAESPGYVAAAYCDGNLHAQFRRSENQAIRYCEFMRGERWAK